ncbi:hypothetical protein BU26DRAFT_263899 [Trematosphaeria pertusa]|uniref:Uncharacterized protein n=1 Tax=Trematosphaeria pertusa TaxID=390896 RepID=A0A6A6IJR8_9PLEO|nr:uncharacterized protein BU26DRAFT_263899 [Trematosphaeria pertusa]KAF2250469.1 hypothetical protein BU26DRAFT_263899 [Trematosphaeria pertusa]
MRAELVPVLPNLGSHLPPGILLQHFSLPPHLSTSMRAPQSNYHASAWHKQSAQSPTATSAQPSDWRWHTLPQPLRTSSWCQSPNT